MMRISKRQETYLVSLKRQVGEAVDFAEIRKLYTADASKEIDRIKWQIAEQGIRA